MDDWLTREEIIAMNVPLEAKAHALNMLRAGARVCHFEDETGRGFMFVFEQDH